MLCGSVSLGVQFGLIVFHVAPKKQRHRKTITAMGMRERSMGGRGNLLNGLGVCFDPSFAHFDSERRRCVHCAGESPAIRKVCLPVSRPFDFRLGVTGNDLDWRGPCDCSRVVGSASACADAGADKRSADCAALFNCQFCFHGSVLLCVVLGLFC